jgi:DNA-binding MarR family transcriptional regulator
LERASFVERLVDSKDKRSFNIRLTADGAELIEEVFRKHLEMIDSFFSGLDSGERQVLQSLLKKLNGL